jgi:GT2 family glycosyltransferase
MTHSHVTAIVVNWKLREETLKCLRSLEQLDHPCRIIVVDNGSSDGSADYITCHFPQAELVALPSNIGFAAACNRAITHALKDTTCEYVFLFNNDAVIHPHAISELLRAAKVHPQAGILGPKMYYSDRPNTLWYAGARRRWGVLAAADTGRGQIDLGQFDTLRQVDYVFGTAMLIHRSVFERIGLFDEGFFLYLEDLDFCLRAQAAGFSLLFVPQAQIWHQGSASTSHNPAMRKYHTVKSTSYFLRKHTSLASSLPVIIFWMLVLFRDILIDLAQGKSSVIQLYWAGLIDGLVGDISYGRVALPTV